MSPDQEIYVFKHLSLIDMERVQKSITLMLKSKDEYIKEALFRDAVVSYMRPFSDNRGEHIARGLKLKNNVIPNKFRKAHKEIESIRNQLFAHNDLTQQNVQFGPGSSFSLKGYERVFLNHLVGPLKDLASIVHSNILKEMSELRDKGL